MEITNGTCNEKITDDRSFYDRYCLQKTPYMQIMNVFVVHEISISKLDRYVYPNSYTEMICNLFENVHTASYKKNFDIKCY